jgi:inhibitor of cysteine peptidase
MAELGPADDGTSHTLRVGEELVLALPENPTTGSRWQVTAGTPVLVESGSDYAMRSAATGAGGTRTLRFTATAPGDAELRLVHHQPWNPDDPYATTFTVTVHVTA